MTDEELRARFACAALTGMLSQPTRIANDTEFVGDVLSWAGLMLAEYRKRWPEEGGKNE